MRSKPDCSQTGTSAGSAFRATRKTRYIKFTSISITVITRRVGGPFPAAGVAQAARHPTASSRSRIFLCRPAIGWKRSIDPGWTKCCPRPVGPVQHRRRCPPPDHRSRMSPINPGPGLPRPIHAEVKTRPNFLRETRSSWTTSRKHPATPAPGQPRPPGAGAANIGPELSAPAGTPPAIQGARTSQIESTDEAAGRDDDGPLLALPSVNLAPVNDPGVPFGTQPPPPTTDSATNANATTAASRHAAVSLADSLVI